MSKKLEDFDRIDNGKIWGEGTFSTVVKVKEKKTQKDFALKTIDLSKLSPGDYENLKNEISLHKNLKHKNIIKFEECFQIGNVVYLLLEEASNGSLFFFISSETGLPEHLAVRFLYQTTKAVKYLHDNQIIHRDIKPENILLDCDLNVKLCDFGWSCWMTEKERRDSLCGTYEYMSPELVHEKGYSYKIDIWCLGILFYEMLHGAPPFNGTSIEEMKVFLNKHISFKNNLNVHVVDLLKKMLAFNEVDRITLDEILRHNVFNEFSPFLENTLDKKFVEVMVTNYSQNVRSGKKNEPLCVEQFHRNHYIKNENNQKNNEHIKNDYLNKEISGSQFNDYFSNIHHYRNNNEINKDDFTFHREPSYQTNLNDKIKLNNNSTNLPSNLENNADYLKITQKNKYLSFEDYFLNEKTIDNKNEKISNEIFSKKVNENVKNDTFCTKNILSFVNKKEINLVTNNYNNDEIIQKNNLRSSQIANNNNIDLINKSFRKGGISNSLIVTKNEKKSTHYNNNNKINFLSLINSEKDKTPNILKKEKEEKIIHSTKDIIKNLNDNEKPNVFVNLTTSKIKKEFEDKLKKFILKKKTSSNYLNLQKNKEKTYLFSEREKKNSTPLFITQLKNGLIKNHNNKSHIDFNQNNLKKLGIDKIESLSKNNSVLNLNTSVKKMKKNESVRFYDYDYKNIKDNKIKDFLDSNNLSKTDIVPIQKNSLFEIKQNDLIKNVLKEDNKKNIENEYMNMDSHEKKDKKTIESSVMKEISKNSEKDTETRRLKHNLTEKYIFKKITHNNNNISYSKEKLSSIKFLNANFENNSSSLIFKTNPINNFDPALNKNSKNTPIEKEKINSSSLFFENSSILRIPKINNENLNNERKQCIKNEKIISSSRSFVHRENSNNMDSNQRLDSISFKYRYQKGNLFKIEKNPEKEITPLQDKVCDPISFQTRNYYNMKK